MKIYISVDLEGIGGVVRPAQVKTGEAPDYEKTRDWATQEVLAVCAGATDAGATEIWIKDAQDRGNQSALGRLSCQHALDLRQNAPPALSGP